MNPRRIVLGAAVCAILPAPARAADAIGIVEPVAAICEMETHTVTDPCDGTVSLVRSAFADLNALVCRNVRLSGERIGAVCPAIDTVEVAEAPPACRIEVRDSVAPGDPVPVLQWARMPCGRSYDVVRGSVGIPAFNGCADNGGCAADRYCAKPPGNCGAIGSCALKPRTCTAIVDPVCGCDGQPYSNPCVAAFFGAAVACKGSCPCPDPCPVPGACLDVGPVQCLANDYAPTTPTPGIGMSETPPPGLAYFYVVRAKGDGVVGVTTYGSTSDGRERMFELDCPR